MHPHVNTGITIQRCPKQNKNSVPVKTEKKQRKYRQAKRVGGMGRNKSKLPTSFAIY